MDLDGKGQRVVVRVEAGPGPYDYQPYATAHMLTTLELHVAHRPRSASPGA